MITFVIVNVKDRLGELLRSALIARIYEVFALLCLRCGGQMRVIAFISAAERSRRFSTTWEWGKTWCGPIPFPVLAPD